MDFKGSFQVSADAKRAWSIISNANEFSKCLPDVNSAEINGDAFNLVFSPDMSKYTDKFLGASYLSNIRIKFQGSIKNKQELKHAEMEGKGSAAGLKFSLSIIIDIDDNRNPIEINWRATIEVGGLAKIFGETVITEAIKTTVDTVISSIKARIESK